MILNPNKRIVGKQVYLRPITDSDEDTNNIIRWRNSEVVRPFFIYQKPFTVEGHKKWLEEEIFAGKKILRACGIDKNYAEIISAAISCAKNAAGDHKDRFVAFDMGPTGRMLKPLGDMDFEYCVSLYADNVKVASQCGADLIIIETMNDCLETKAAVLAAKENSDLPVFVTNVYDGTGKLMTGANPKAMIAMLEGLGVDAIGMNCSFGPDKMLDIIGEFQKYSSLPVIVNPNAGLPEIKDGDIRVSPYIQSALGGKTQPGGWQSRHFFHSLI